MRDILIFAAGLGIGAAGTFFLVKKHYEKVADEEIEAMREHYIHKSEERVEEEPVEAPTRPQKPSLEELRKRYVSEDEESTEAYFEHPEDSDEDEEDYADGYSKEELDSIGVDQQEDYERRKKLAPQLISVDEFGELPNFDTAELLYYEEDDRLTDEDDNDIEDPIALLGTATDHIDEEDVFVRNFRLATDYHIHKVM